MAEANVLILLSTYNGEKWLEELLESIKNQSYKNWTLLVRDDSSNDSTLNIVKQYAQSDSRIVLTEDQLGNLGPTQSFSKLIELSISYPQEYIFFCDQDDVWQSNKLDRFLLTFLENENSSGKNTPTLLHSQLKSCDEKGTLLNISYHNQMNFDPEESQDKLSHLLVQNFIVGCSSAINKCLAKIACPIPPNVLMHDWWCSLIACSLGKIIFIDEALVTYRIHRGNASGAGQNSLIKKISNSSRFIDLIEARKLQAIELKLRLSSRSTQSSGEKILYIEQFIEALEDKTLKGFWALTKLKLKMQGIDRSLAFYGAVLIRALGFTTNKE